MSETAKKVAKHPATTGGGLLAIVLVLLETGALDRFAPDNGTAEQMHAMDKRVQRIEDTVAATSDDVRWLVGREWGRAGGDGPPPPTPRGLAPIHADTTEADR